MRCVMVEDMSVSLRIAELVKATTLDTNEFDKKIGVTPVMIKHLLGGRNYPSHDTYVKLKKVFPKLNFYWLIFGIGSMWEEESQDAKEASRLAATTQNAGTPLTASHIVTDAPTPSFPHPSDPRRGNSSMGTLPLPVVGYKEEAKEVQATQQQETISAAATTHEATSDHKTEAANGRTPIQDNTIKTTVSPIGGVDNTDNVSQTAPPVPTQERRCDTTPPSPKPLLPDLIVLQPDGRYIRYRAVEE